MDIDDVHMTKRVPVNKPKVCDQCDKQTMVRAEKGLKVAVAIYAVFGGVLTYAMRNDRVPTWMEGLPNWLQSVIGITAVGSFLVVMAYYTLDRTRSYVCNSCGYKIDVHHPLPKWMKVYGVFLLFALGVLAFLLIGLGIVLFMDL